MWRKKIKNRKIYLKNNQKENIQAEINKQRKSLYDKKYKIFIKN